MTIQIPIFQNAHDNHGRVYIMDVMHAAQRFARHDEDANKDGLASAAGLHDGLFRGKDHMKWRTSVWLDIEADKSTGAVPPSFDALQALLKARGILAVLYTTINHTIDEPRIRLWLPLSEPIDVQTCGPGVDRMMSACVAGSLQLRGVVDVGKFGCASLMYL